MSRPQALGFTWDLLQPAVHESDRASDHDVSRRAQRNAGHNDRLLIEVDQITPNRQGSHEPLERPLVSSCRVVNQDLTPGHTTEPTPARDFAAPGDPLPQHPPDSLHPGVSEGSSVTRWFSLTWTIARPGVPLE
jgi:hypothetical protein